MFLYPRERFCAAGAIKTAHFSLIQPRPMIPWSCLSFKKRSLHIYTGCKSPFRLRSVEWQSSRGMMAKRGINSPLYNTVRLFLYKNS